MTFNGLNQVIYTRGGRHVGWLSGLRRRLVTLRPKGRGFESRLRKGRHMFRLGYVALSCNPCYSEAEQRPFRWAKSYHAMAKYHTARSNGTL